MENKHQIIARLKQYLLDVTKADNEQLDVLVSDIKGYIYSNILKEEYDRRIQEFEKLTKQSNFIETLSELYTYITTYYNPDFILNNYNLAQNLSFNLIEDFYYNRYQAGRDIQYYLGHKYALFNFISEILIDSIPNANLSIKTNIMNILLNLQSMLENTYSFYLLSTEDRIINLYEGGEVFILEYKLALLDVLNDLIKYLKSNKNQEIIDMCNKNTNLLKEKYKLTDDEINLLRLRKTLEKNTYEEIGKRCVPRLTGNNVSQKFMSIKNKLGANSADAAVNIYEKIIEKIK